MIKVCVFGHFGFGKELLNGQTIKTKIVTKELKRALGEEQVKTIDTHGGIKALLKLPFQTLAAMCHCKNIVIFPANNGLRVLTPMLTVYRCLFKRSLHYVVIGGWLPSFLEGRRRLEKQLKRFDGIYVETTTMKQALRRRGFTNVVVMPNCKALKILGSGELNYSAEEPRKLCTFSRVMKEKGIEDAVKAVKDVNKKYGRTVYTLDIYGQVDSEQTDWFDRLQEDFPDYVHYCRAVPFDQSTEVLKNYFALLFPTHFYTEGIPGTLIDAYAAGVPVISARWESFGDVVEEGKNGLGYDFDRYDALVQQLEYVCDNVTAFQQMKPNCLTYAKRFLPDEAIGALKDRLV